MIVTAVLTTGIGQIAAGMDDAVELVDRILAIEHLHQESILAIGDAAYLTTKQGPYPNCLVRVSVSPRHGYAALIYIDHGDTKMSAARSYNPHTPSPDVDLICNEINGSVFPRSSLISIESARMALIEWLETRERPTCIKWTPVG